MKDSPNEKVGKIKSLYLAIHDSPKEKVGKKSSFYLAINEGLPEGECREDIAPLPNHK
jgi:hypothetical protein